MALAGHASNLGSAVNSLPGNALMHIISLAGTSHPPCRCWHTAHCAVIATPQHLATWLVVRTDNPTAALAKACLGNKAQAAAALLDRGVPLDPHLLPRAAGLGHTEVVKVLLSRGADVHVDCDAALRAATAQGHSSVVAVLCDAGACVDVWGSRPLRSAAGRGFSSVVRELLDRGADVHAGNDRPLQRAAYHGHLDVVHLLLQRQADVHAGNGAALKWACHQGHMDVVRELIHAGADLQAHGRGALLWARHQGHKAVVELLLQHMAGPQGAEPDAAEVDDLPMEP